MTFVVIGALRIKAYKHNYYTFNVILDIFFICAL